MDMSSGEEEGNSSAGGRSSSPESDWPLVENGAAVMGDPGLDLPEECELHKTQLLENGHVCQILIPDDKCEVHDGVNGAIYDAQNNMES
ncbi:hypothetical protein GWI33_008513 [Rhynchophorus ferrugineus]|uniref:Uncharacterized protein n=1 Tax=Rhynchophorus ferrugineus TaxID=354439 RepID=A0A834MFX0_RHYFE|nr:hypothetical protein GWI33_008513 [Rhynchophorus ferrugineus]